MDPRSFNVLSLCSGGGGLDLGLGLAVPDARVVCYVENEAFACEVLASQMDAGNLDQAPIWTDLRSFDGEPWRDVVDCVAGGFPCQPHSIAGSKLGKEDPRNLWPEVHGIVQAVRPAFVFFENVPNILNTIYSEIREDLREIGYRVEQGIFSAEEVGGPHLRKRLFILGYNREFDVADPGRQHGQRGEGLQARNGVQDGEKLGDGPEEVSPAERRGQDVGGGKEELAHPRRDGRRELPQVDDVHGEDAPGHEPDRGRQEVADPEDGGRGVLREPPGGAGQPDRGCEDVDHADCGRHGNQEGQIRPRGDAAVPPGEQVGGEGLADAVGGGRREGGVEGGVLGVLGEAQDDAGEAQEPGGVLGDPERPRRDGREGEGVRTDGPPLQASRPGYPSEQLGLFPPGPDESGRWAEVLSEAPTVEPSVRVLADELARRLEQPFLEDRTLQLRLLGNGVVPTSAAFAFCVLLSSLLGNEGPECAG